MPALSPVIAAAITCALCASSLAQAPVRQFVDESVPDSRALGGAVDVDGDGLADLIAFEPGQLGWHRNLGLGRFAPYATLASGTFDPVFKAFDHDNDGDVDFVVLEPGSIGNSSITVFLIEQSANLTFTVTTIGQLPAVSNYPSYVDALDLDGDGDLDLIAGTTAPPASANSALRNDGGGTFTNVTAQWFGGMFLLGQRAPIVLDADGDGRPDLLFNPSNVNLLRNTGTGFVDETATRLPGSAPSGEGVAGDVDGDGDVDLLINSYFAPMQLLINQAGVFTAAGAGSLPTLQGTPMFADLDGDGDLDAAVYDQGPELHVLGNDGAGNFTAVPGQGSMYERYRTPRKLAAVDVEGDGDLDVLLLYGDLLVLHNDGRAHLAPRPSSTTLPAPNSAWIAADLDGDGDLDLIGGSGWLRNDRNDQWQSQPLTSITSALRGVDQIGDIDGDGDLDLVGARVWRNDGSGNFTLDSANGYAPASFYDATLGDFDLDGDLDIVVGEGILQSAFHRLYLNDGTGGFTAGPTLQTGTWLLRTTVTDSDGDGRPDVLLFGALIYGQPQLLRNTTTGFVSIPLPALIGDMQFADFGAGHDLIVTNGSTRVFRQAGGAFVDVTSAVIPPGFAGEAAIGDYDNDGDLDLVGTDILQNDGAGNFTLVPVGLSASPIALADVDGDRDLEAITGRAVLWNRERQLLLPLAPHIGRNLRVEISSRPGRAAGDLAVLGLGLTSPAVGIPGPLGLLFLDQPLAMQLVAIPSGTGILELDLPVPNVAGIVGVDLHMQALHWTPTGLGLGNAVIARIE
ncbi:MAG: VCBS repeat-containing protein [Planctomycetes bacterium]|nr:VCBS repeat-containing protein [Planctomycetota bacterium]